jgi:hypothetical protein
MLPSCAMPLVGLTLLVSACDSGGAHAIDDAGKRDAAHDAAAPDARRDGRAHDAHLDASAPIDARATDTGAAPDVLPDAPASADVSVPCQPVDAGSIFGGSSCSECLTTACCEQVARCVAPADGGPSPCALLALCVAACEGDGGTESACELSCSEAYPAGIDLAETVNDCLTTHCTGDAGDDACGAP